MKKTDELSKKQRRTLLVLFLTVLVTVSFSAIAYSYLQGNVYYEGNNKIRVKSKGVDVLQMHASEDVFLEINHSNFSKDSGSNVSGTTKMNLYLDTTKDRVKYCYKTIVALPNEQVFAYSVVGKPELLLDVEYASDGINYTKVINQKDITTLTGQLPVVFNNIDKYTLSTTKGKAVNQRWKATLTFVWYDNINQYINNNKTYRMELKTEVVDC
ncbi:MAG: hypothetical protein GX951_01300 [Mollicutes bacterium]|nr:hypothetical protein [Mollicutes bacterium]